MSADRQATREAMPQTAAIVDEVRATFGAPAWFRFTENGRTLEWGRQHQREREKVPGEHEQD